MENNMKFLLDYCTDKVELYNKVATELWVQFEIRSAHLALLCTFIADKMMKGEKTNDH